MRRAIAALLILWLPALAIAACRMAPNDPSYDAAAISRPNPLQVGGGGGAAGGM
jgi:hypothetical protein